MDRRLTPFNGRIAHVSLRGQVAAEVFVEGAYARLTAPLTDLDRSPGGPRDRQVMLGDRVLVLDRRDGWAFLRGDKDGYVGWVPEAALGPDHPVTHWVAVPSSHLYPEARVQAREIAALPFLAQVEVTGMEGKFARTPHGFIPLAHLRGVGEWFTDPVAVAEMMAGAPYLWGGNARSGIDCSGLVQGALLACAMACPGDSDQQMALGGEVAGEVRRGDLIFWPGHVAFVSGPDTIFHATGYGMTTRWEGLAEAIARIDAQGDGPVTARRRIG